MVSVCILTWNRKETVIENIKSVLRQSYQDFELIVVDNGSEDNTSNELQKLFKNLKLISFDENIGIAARNAGIKASEGKIIVTLDDDVFFADENSLERIVNYFDMHPEVHVGVMKILDVDYSLLEMNWYHPREWELYSDIEFETDYIAEGAAFFRKEIFEKTGMYPDSFFIGQEGPDLAYRILDNNFVIKYVPEIRVIHKSEKSGKTKKRFVYYNIRNHFKIAVRNFSWPRAMYYILYRMATMFLYSLWQKNLYWYFLGVKDGLLSIPKELLNRKPLKKSTIKKIREIRKHQPSIIKRFLYQIRRQKIRKKKYDIFN